MHEIGITRNMLSLVLKEAEKAGAKRVKNIDLVIGGLTGVLEYCVKFYLEILSKGTIAEGATISIKVVSPLALCQKCNTTSVFKPGIEWQCPNCNNTRMQIAGGRELIVKSIDIELGKEKVLVGEV